MTTTRPNTGGSRRKQVLFDVEIGTLDPNVLGAENNVLRALVERLELLARARQQSASPASPLPNSKKQN
ncbi:MAG: hypothetical protein U0X20_23850 [Caldilineaceae bacterium]